MLFYGISIPDVKNAPFYKIATINASFLRRILGRIRAENIGESKDQIEILDKTENTGCPHAEK